MCATTSRPRSSTTTCCRRSCPTPTSTPACSTRTASTGSPARTACTATSIPRPASTRAGSRRAAAPTASPSRRRNEVWYVALAGDHLGKIDKATGNVTIVEPHKKGAGPRRVWTDSKGLLWVSFWHSGEVGVYDPAAKTWKTWLLPEQSRQRLLFGLCRRAGQGLAHRLHDQRDRALRSRRPRSSRASRATSAAPRCARCWAGPARPGARNPATTGWCVVRY